VQWDNEFGLGLEYMGARHLAPSLGRFLQPDAVNSPQLPPYAYALNNPLTMSDPDGKTPRRVTMRNRRRYGDSVTVGIGVGLSFSWRVGPVIITQALTEASPWYLVSTLETTIEVQYCSNSLGLFIGTICLSWAPVKKGVPIDSLGKPIQWTISKVIAPWEADGYKIVVRHTIFWAPGSVFPIQSQVEEGYIH
jgi:RHS repeat-associated protein